MVQVWTDRESAELLDWIQQLRGRVESGEVANRGPIKLADDSWFARTDLAATILLDELDNLDDLPEAEREHPRTVAGRELLLHDFRRLRERLGESGVIWRRP